jgi:hypothetical protein
MQNGTFTEIEFTEFQEMNTGSVDKYINNKEINELIHNNRKEKYNNKIFTISDWCEKSEHYISVCTWDCGREKFVSLGVIKKDMNKIQ